MKIENEHLTIMALLMVLPLGLNGKTATPATDLLITLMAVSAVPTLLLLPGIPQEPPSQDRATRIK